MTLGDREMTVLPEPRFAIPTPRYRAFCSRAACPRKRSEGCRLAILLHCAWDGLCHGIGYPNDSLLSTGVRVCTVAWNDPLLPWASDLARARGLAGRHNRATFRCDLRAHQSKR